MTAAPHHSALSASARHSARRAFVRAQWAAVAATVLTIVAMLRYPGGTPIDHATPRYRLTQNFLSDLGMTVAYDGNSNRIGASLFVSSLGILIVGYGNASYWLIRVYSTTGASRSFARASGAVAVAVALSFLGVGLTPENSAMNLHVQFTLFAFRAFPVASVLLLLAAWTSGAVTRVVVAWIIATACLTAYVAFLSFGPPPTTPDGLVASVIAQKSVVVAIVAVLTYLYRQTAHLLEGPSLPLAGNRR